MTDLVTSSTAGAASNAASRDRSGRSRLRLRGATSRAALVAHVLASVGWFGAAVVVAFCGVAAGFSGDDTTAAALFRTITLVIGLTVPLGLLAVATGVVLSLGTKWGVIRYWWVVAKLAIAAAVLVTDVAVVRWAAFEALRTGSAPGPLYGSTIAHCVVLGVATYLSVFKPGGRVRRR